MHTDYVIAILVVSVVCIVVVTLVISKNKET